MTFLRKLHPLILFFIFDLVISFPASHNEDLLGSNDDYSGLEKDVSSLKKDIESLYDLLHSITGTDENQNSFAKGYSLQNEKNICLSEACIASSHRLFNNIDLSVDPCQDFYKYSCGNYIKEAIIPDDKKKLTSFSPLEDISI